MRNRIVNSTTKPKSLAQIKREERESKSQRTPATGRASASAGASVSHSSAKPANLISSANENRPLKTLPQIEREERESTRQSSRSHAAGNASGGVGNVFSKINTDSIIRAADTARNGSKATRTERYRIQTADVPSTSTSDQRAEAALLAKLPSDFPIDRWDNMSTKEQNSIMRRSGLTVQEQWKLLNATTPMKALSVLNAVQAGLNNGTLTSREAAALTGGSLRYLSVSLTFDPTGSTDSLKTGDPMAVFKHPHKNKQLSKRILLLSLCMSLLGVQLGCVVHNPRFNQFDSLTFAANLKADPLSSSGKKAAYAQNRIYYLSSELGEQGIYSMDAGGGDVKLEIPVEDIRAIQLFDDEIYYSGFAGVRQNDNGPYRQ